MGGQENAMGFQHGNESILTSEMAISSVSMANKQHSSSEVVANPFLASVSSAWDPLVSLSQAQTFGGSSMVSHTEFANANSPYPPPLVLENQGMSSTSHLVQQYMSDHSNLASMVHHKVPSSYGSGSFSEMVPSFGGSGGIAANTGYPPHYNPIKDAAIERAPINGEQSQVDQDSVPEEGATGSGPSGNRRKRGLDQNSTFSPNKVCFVKSLI